MTRSAPTRRRVHLARAATAFAIPRKYSSQPGTVGALDYDTVPGLGDYDRPGTPGFCIAIHAEVNALLFATRDTKGATAYITDPPCPGCRKALAAAGIVRAVWPGGEHDRAGLTTWT